MKVLLVEDDPVHAMLFENFFQTVDPMSLIVVCKRFVTFKGIVATDNFDLFVIDYNLDCYTAPEYIDIIKADKDHDGTPILVMSASFDPGDREKLSRIGVMTMEKTGDMEVFASGMKKLLESWNK